jgi:hypothetical protein
MKFRVDLAELYLIIMSSDLFHVILGLLEMWKLELLKYFNVYGNLQQHLLLLHRFFTINWWILDCFVWFWAR